MGVGEAIVVLEIVEFEGGNGVGVGVCMRGSVSVTAVFSSVVGGEGVSVSSVLVAETSVGMSVVRSVGSGLVDGASKG